MILLPVTLQSHYSLLLLSTLPLHCSYSAETLQFLDNETLRGSGMRCLVVLRIRTHSHAVCAYLVSGNANVACNGAREAP